MVRAIKRGDDQKVQASNLAAVCDGSWTSPMSARNPSRQLMRGAFRLKITKRVALPAAAHSSIFTGASSCVSSGMAVSLFSV